MQSDKNEKQRNDSRYKTRKLTISAIVTPESDWFVPDVPKIRPLIRLSGNWLQKSGFHPGRKILVTQTDSSLIITLDPI